LRGEGALRTLRFLRGAAKTISMAGEEAGEKVVRKFHPSPLYYWGWYLVGALLIFPGVLLLVVPAFLGMLAIAYAELERRAVTYTITDRRIVKESGIFGKHTASTIYARVTDVNSSQSFMQRMLGIGNLYINTAGSPGPEIVLRGIGGMGAVKADIERAWSASRNA
jgi:uncharacterized membrane protein YdbT with pleckstrin-like domain